ncbi:putative DUF302 domain protein [Campylobacter pinnipediorum subsp. pinnipediorum]|uniref:DUF302 domain-containing protein n=1 Tax=Campylobacter pinnipediorum TaxID=1965231 RepID=UPI000994E2A7|nr:DUF302 domain-containing protein [Campylobacter pinnipediorum]AQW84036.1 putative DUF302 domain protein [Campylobacter pinnipediorum subsp. pinnipediorum]
MKKIFILALFTCLAFSSSNLIKLQTNLSVDETTKKALEILKSKELKVFDVIQHSKLAKDVGLDMSDTTVIIFGSPKVGTLLMQCSNEIALELPLKFLIYKSQDKTILAYEDIKQTAKRYNAQDCNIVSKISEVQDKLSHTITK